MFVAYLHPKRIHSLRSFHAGKWNDCQGRKEYFPLRHLNVVEMCQYHHVGRFSSAQHLLSCTKWYLMSLA